MNVVPSNLALDPALNLNPPVWAFGLRLSSRLRLRLRLRGFTLIEIVISSSLMALILVSGYLCLNAAVASQKQIEPRLTVIQNARVAMAIMAADLRAACPLSKECDFLGADGLAGDIEADNLVFATHNYTPRRANEGDFCEVSYFLRRSRNPASTSFIGDAIRSSRNIPMREQKTRDWWRQEMKKSGVDCSGSAWSIMTGWIGTTVGANWTGPAK